MKATDMNDEPIAITFLDYKIHRNLEGQVQFDKELDLTKLNGEWKEGDVLGLSVHDGRVTLTKL